MNLSRRLLSLVLLLALVGSSAALAARGDPQESFTKADQARAKSMLLRITDLGPGFVASPVGDGSVGSCPALDESDLTITGKALSPQFAGGTAFASSTVYVYESRVDVNASWGRGTSAAGQKCLRDGLRRSLAGTALRLRSFKKLPFPRLAQHSVAYRLLADRQGVRIYVDLVAMQQSRAQAAIFLGSVLVAPPRSEELRLARLVAGRMAKAMRGS